MKNKSKNKEKLKLLSLFSGIGAFEKSLTNIGVNYDLVGFSEINKWATTSYCAIHGIDRSLNLGDISKIDNKDLPTADLITYGFPCQDISSLGVEKGIGKDTRSGLLFQAERIIKEVKPKYAVAENVKNLINKTYIKDFNELLKRLNSYGYNNYYGVLNAKDFNIPQNRERVFLISIRKDVDKYDFVFPVGRKIDRPLKDFLDASYNDKYLLKTNYPKIIQFTKDDKGKDLVLVASKAKDSFKELRPIKDTVNLAFPSVVRRHRVGESCALTIDTNCRQYVLQDGKLRRLKPIEVWRLMGFTDNDYNVAKKELINKHYNGNDMSDSQMYRQAGNSIVVPVLEDIFKILLSDYIRG